MFAFPVYEPRTFVTSGHQGTLGFGFPTALGVKVAFPQRPVDLRNRGRRLHVCRPGAGDRGSIRHQPRHPGIQQQQLRQRVTAISNSSSTAACSAPSSSNPDFVRLAESFGVSASAVESPEALRPALERALGADRPMLIEVKVPRGRESDPWRIIAPTFT